MGNRILLANKTKQGKRKLADRWESDSYEVTWKDPKLPVYHIKKVGSDEEKMVQWNLIIPANFLPLDVEQEEVVSSGGSSDDQAPPSNIDRWRS